MSEQHSPIPQTPPGYYPDGTGAMRWWDGQRWVEHIQPTAVQPEPLITPRAQPEPSQPQQLRVETAS